MNLLIIRNRNRRLQLKGSKKHFKLRIILFITTVFVFSNIYLLNAQTSVLPEWQKGINFTNSMTIDKGYGSIASLEAMKQAKKINVRWIAVVPFLYQPNPTKGEINFMSDLDPGCVTEKNLRTTIIEAHELGLKVMLKPHLWVGSIGLRSSINLITTKEISEWFSNYQKLILTYAKIAQEEKVEMLSIGVELGELTTTSNNSKWRSLIRKIRSIYNGRLIYSANWDKEFEQIQFWDLLDFMGLDYYFPLKVNDNTPDSEVVNKINIVSRYIEEIQKKWNKSLIFTEIGFRSAENSAYSPWKPQNELVKPDMKVQEICYKAIFEVYWNKPWLWGMYWWKWTSDPDDGGIHNNKFTPKHKPAELILSQWYSLKH